METKEVAKKLVEYCKRGENLKAVDELYGDDVVSVEVFGTPEMPAEIRGKDKIRGKNQWWFDNHEIHGASVEGPYPHNDRFAVKFHYDVTAKEGPMAGKRMKMDEIGLYTVKNGKIVREEFFYDM
jgi:ketosteroid isomerase-like protein